MHSKSISGLNIYVNASLNYKYSNLHIPRIYINPLRLQKKNYPHINELGVWIFRALLYRSDNTIALSTSIWFIFVSIPDSLCLSQMNILVVPVWFLYVSGAQLAMNLSFFTDIQTLDSPFLWTDYQEVSKPCYQAWRIHPTGVPWKWKWN